MERKNAKITDTFLGWEDHGIFTFMLGLDYGGVHQGAGQLCLGNDKGVHARTGELISAILRTVGVDQWEKLPGRYVIAICDEGWNGLVRGIAPVLGGDDLIFAEMFEGDFYV
jgi:hypothetical protein